MPREHTPGTARGTHAPYLRSAAASLSPPPSGAPSFLWMHCGGIFFSFVFFLARGRTRIAENPSLEIKKKRKKKEGEISGLIFFFFFLGWQNGQQYARVPLCQAGLFKRATYNCRITEEREEGERNPPPPTPQSPASQNLSLPSSLPFPFLPSTRRVGVLLRRL